ncbi:hypothetical protein [Phaeovulum sp.]|uniref:hypothetical protein n=1 Tax=Phaeovulum sp. TaxID=2934796 RepID=UPI00356945FC
MPDYDYDAYCKKLARKAGASDEIRGPTLTLDPRRATVIVLPKEGRKLTAKDKEFSEWKRKLC